MKFSEHFGVGEYDEERYDWFDTYLLADTKLFVDPFLIYEERDGRWAPAHDHLLAFFEMAFSLVGDAKSEKTSLPWKKAGNLLLFPEPGEFCLGVAEGTPHGSGSGRGLRDAVLEGIKTALGLGLAKIEHMELIALFQEGIGVDRISDITCNVLKKFFIEYTQSVCKDLGIETKRYRVTNAEWSAEFKKWQDRDAQLPANPYYNQPVLLTPHRFLRTIPVAESNAFWAWAWKNEGEQLRGDFNYDIATNVPARVRASLARQNPAVVTRFLNYLESVEKPPYPIGDDPQLLSKWYEAGAEIAQGLAPLMTPPEPAQFADFVYSIVGQFQHYVEEQDGWRLLWNQGRRCDERRVQALFRGTVIHYCKANDVDLSGEPNAGRGPVDFKFSKGWAARSLVEIKLSNNSAFWHGLRAQTPQYLKSEQMKSAVFVAVAFNDREMHPDAIKDVADAAKKLSTEAGYDVRTVVVDARPKTSASKLRT